MGRALAGTIMKDISDPNNPDSGLQKLHEDIQKNLTPKDIYERHSETLRKLGIDIESPNKEGDIDENETYAAGEVSINLTDKDLYLKYLKTLHKDNLQEETKELLKMMSEKFVRQVQQEYSLDSADDRLLELLSGLKNIVAEYERAGMNEEVSGLKEYQEYMNSGYLREYISARNHRMFEPIGTGFNLSTFQRDASYDYYTGAWQSNFFDQLEKIKQNPKAEDFYKKVLEYGKACLDFAEKDIEEIRSRYSGSHPEYVSNVEKAIKDTRTKFESIKI